MLTVDQYACLGVRFSKERLWGVHTRNLAEKWKTRVGKLCSMLPDRGLDRGIQRDSKYSQSVMVLSCYRGITLPRVLLGVKRAAKVVEVQQCRRRLELIFFGCSTRKSNAAARAELGTYRISP